MKYTLKGGILQAFLEQICYFFKFMWVGFRESDHIQGDHKGRPYYGRVEPNVGGYLTIGAFALKMRQLHINSSM